MACTFTIAMIVGESPATWSAETGWRDNTAYTKSTTRKALTRLMYRYREYGEWSSWVMCDISGCPESTSTRQIEIRTGAG